MTIALTSAGSWTVSAFGYVTPPDRWHEAESALVAVAATLAFDPDWSMIEAKGAMERLRILASAQQKVFEIIQDVTVNQARAASGAALSWSRYIRHGDGVPIKNAMTGATGSVSASKLPGLIQQNPNIATNW